MSLQAPRAASPRKGRCGIVIRTYERAELHEHVVTPDIVWETIVEAATLVWDGAGTSADRSLDIGQNLAPLVVKAQRTRRSSKSFTLNVPQQIEDSRRPSATVAPNGLPDSNDGRVGTAVEGKLWLNHSSS
jgi:hypothetical protein